MKYQKEQWMNRTDDTKIRTIQDELTLETHNGTTKEDLLMMLRWLFDQFNIAEPSRQRRTPKRKPALECAARCGEDTHDGLTACEVTK